MDKYIKKIQKDTSHVQKKVKGLQKEEAKLLRMDKKNDKLIYNAKKELKKKK